MIITEIKDINQSRKSASLTIPAETLASSEKTILKKLVGQVRIPGFRQGKVPPEVLRRQYSDLLTDDLRKKIISDALDHIGNETKLEIYALIDAEGLDKINPAEDLAVTLTVDIIPDFQLPEYKGLDIPAETAVVSEEEIQKRIDELAVPFAKFNKVERAVEKDDFVKLSYAGTIDGTPVKQIAPNAYTYGERSIAWEQGGDENFEIPAITKGIIGKKTGETAEFTHEFPDDFELAELRGKKAVYTVKILEARERKQPAMDESFFKEIGVNNFEDLHEKTRLELLEVKNNRIQKERREKAIALLLEKIDFVPPESIVQPIEQDVLERIADEYFRENRGAEITEPVVLEMKKEGRIKAEKHAKEQVLLKKIAQKENISVTERELVSSIGRFAERLGKNPMEFAREIVKDRRRLNTVSDGLLCLKVADFILENLKQ
ncbi:MAG: trigger factor [Puniceicoccales bacterium]|nr:trigger factor [Puniceicoccales bacterium]